MREKMCIAGTTALLGRSPNMAPIPQDAIQAYVFTNSDELLNAVSRERNGANLPLVRGPWTFQKEIVLGVQEPPEIGIDPEPVLRGIRAEGYFIWRTDNINPFGTSQ
jgi:hypothetical protein